MFESKANALLSLGVRWLKRLSLRSTFAVHMGVTSLILLALGGMMLGAYFSEYGRVGASVEYAKLAVCLSEVIDKLQAERKGAATTLLGSPVLRSAEAEAVGYSAFNESCAQTDLHLLAAKKHWGTMSKEGTDAISLARIEDVFRRASRLEPWRRAARLHWATLPAEIAGDELFVSREAFYRTYGSDLLQARRRALFDAVRNGYYSAYSAYLVSVIQHIARLTTDQAASRGISLQAELLRHQLELVREHLLIREGVTKGARPHGLVEFDITELKSTWERQQAIYMDVWTLAQDADRLGAQKALSLESFPRVAAVRRGLSAVFPGVNSKGSPEFDVSQLNNPELMQDLDYTREFTGTQLMRSSRAGMLASLASRLERARRDLILGTCGLLFAWLLVIGGLWWLNRVVLQRVMTLSDKMRHIHGTGDVTIRIPVTAQDEVGELEQAFNEMLGSVEDNRRRLETARTMLEGRVVERTAEVNQRLSQVEQLNKELGLTMEELRVSRDQSEEYVARLSEINQQLIAANQELESFIYSASHDLRSPLRNIVGFVELVRHESGARLDEATAHRLSVVLGEARRLGSLIDALLAFFRVGRAQLHDEPVFIGQLVEEVRAALQQRVSGRRVQWRMGDMPACHGDRDLLRQLVEILLDNALKFTVTREEAHIEIGSKAGDPGRGEIVYYVRDNGVGFNPQYSEKLFRVFQRLHSPREFEGNGIGLANMKRIVLRHGGRVWAEGQPDLGACFYFALPMGERGKGQPGNRILGEGLVER